MERFVITGCSGGGKSTLLKELAGRGFATVQEPGRQIVKEQIASGGDGLPWENVRRFSELCISRSIDAFDSSSGLTFFDRSFLDNLCGLETLGGLGAEHREIIETHRFSNPAFFAPPWSEIYVQDQERKHGVAEALEESERLEVFYPKYGYQLVHLPKASVPERADFVLSVVENL